MGIGRGEARVETARGELLHEISVDGDQVLRYRIVAPTDQLFSAQGPLPDMLTGKAVKSARRLAEHAVMALDPCVPWSVTIE